MVELKSYPAPPQDIKNVMAAVCIMLGVDPSWSTAKKLLGNCDDFRQKLLSCKDNISVSMILLSLHTENICLMFKSHNCKKKTRAAEVGYIIIKIH